MGVNIHNPHNISLTNVVINGIGNLTLGKCCEIRDFTVIEMVGDVSIGDHSVIGYGCFIQSTGTLNIGENTLIGPHCCIICSKHTTKRGYNVKELPFVRGQVTIGNNVWLGAKCTIDADVTLSDGCVIGAHSFVNKDVPGWEIWVGSPAKFLKDVQ